jgi:hypothetical protein
MLTALGHLANLLASALRDIPTELGSTWLGIAFPVMAFVIATLLDAWRHGVIAWKQGWKKALGVGLGGVGLAYVGLYLYCVAATVYSDHEDLVYRLQFHSSAIAESPNSLRRRTLRLAADLSAFYQQENSRYVGADPAEQAKIQDEIFVEYRTNFADRTEGILNELKAKGLSLAPIPTSENDRGLVINPDETIHLKDLAHYLDSVDNVVLIDGK